MNDLAQAVSIHDNGTIPKLSVGGSVDKEVITESSSGKVHGQVQLKYYVIWVTVLRVTKLMTDH